MSVNLGVALYPLSSLLSTRGSTSADKTQATTTTMPLDTTAGEALLARIRESVIGDDNVTWGPYGARRLTYTDYSASGKSLSFIEDFIRQEVLPQYANTHTESSGTALQTIGRPGDHCTRIGADPESSAVIFTGSGSTSAIDKVVNALGLRVSTTFEERFGRGSVKVRKLPLKQRPVVFIGPFEHHSNELAWRETIADVVVIPEGQDGHVSIAALEHQLRRHASRPLLVGSFSAASNVTGITTDTAAVTAVLHRHGALAMFDYAAAGPHVQIQMGDMDAMFLSPHKFIGGVGTPGILVAKRSLLTNKVPVVPGGGTVDFVGTTRHHYIPDVVHREEGGTPAIVESIRAGLVFQLKAAVGHKLIADSEDAFMQRALDALRATPNVEVLGNPKANRLSILSFLISHPNGKYLHHNFVVALLNDVFGIQARGGCSCAGPYGHRLFKLDETKSNAYRNVAVSEGFVGVKPGWVRVTFNYFISETTFNYIITAIKMIAKDGWRLLPQYTFNPRSGLWTNRTPPVRPALRLTDLEYGSDGRLNWSSHAETAPESALEDYLGLAALILAGAADGISSESGHATSETGALAIQSLQGAKVASVVSAVSSHSAISSICSSVSSIPADPTPLPPASVSPHFDKVCWFELPAQCLVAGPEAKNPSAETLPTGRPIFGRKRVSRAILAVAGSLGLRVK